MVHVIHRFAFRTSFVAPFYATKCDKKISPKPFYTQHHRELLERCWLFIMLLHHLPGSGDIVTVQQNIAFKIVFMLLMQIADPTAANLLQISIICTFRVDMHIYNWFFEISLILNGLFSFF